MFKFFEKSIYLDPLTGLPNFFKFVESDVIKLFGNTGAVIICDMIKFGEINRRYGTDAGDVILKKLSETIVYSLEGYKDSSIFRTDGDEFTIVIPELDSYEANELSDRVKNDFDRTVSNMEFENINMRVLTLHYDDITSISKYYKLIFKHSREELEAPDKRGLKHPWSDHIIDSFTRKISETLSFFTDAYVLAMADDISGLPNHRAGKSYLTNLIEESKVSEEAFSVLFIDGDNLRRYNEISYHDGNIMIRNLSNIINGSLRKNDRIFRWFTGDEFLVVLPGVEIEAALRLAERTRRAVEEQTQAWTYPVTISIGVSSFVNDGSSLEDIIARAEKANSFAKNHGKNRVEIWSPEYGELKFG